MTFDDQTLAAYVDGELDPAARALVEAAIRTDADLAARLKAQQDLKALLTDHYGPVATEPLPERLLEAIGNGAPAMARVADLALRRRARGAAPTPKRRPFRAPAWAGMAACLVAGLAVGRLASPPATGLDGANPQALVATGGLARALDGQPAADTSAPIRIGLSFRDKTGRYCRTFQPNKGDGLAGLACREAGVWRLRVAARMTPQAAAYRTAEAEIPAAVLAAVDAMIDGAPLGGAEEDVARRNGWRSAPAPR